MSHLTQLGIFVNIKPTKLVGIKINIFYMIDERKRSIIKGISWRVIASLTTILLIFIFTGNLVLSVEVGFIEVILKLLFYYLHERAWDLVGWGRRPKTEICES